MPKVKVFVAEHCQPCQEVKELLKKGQFLVNGAESELDLVDVESEEGFAEVEKQDGLTGVPQAFVDGKQCKIKIDDETQTVLIECDNERKDEQPDPGK